MPLPLSPPSLSLPPSLYLPSLPLSLSLPPSLSPLPTFLPLISLPLSLPPSLMFVFYGPVCEQTFYGFFLGCGKLFILKKPLLRQSRSSSISVCVDSYPVLRQRQPCVAEDMSVIRRIFKSFSISDHIPAVSIKLTRKC